MTGLPSASVSVQHTSLSADDKPQHRPILQCRSAAGQPIEWGLTGGSLAASEDWSLNPPGAISSAKPDVGRVVQCAASLKRSASKLCIISRACAFVVPAGIVAAITYIPGESESAHMVLAHFGRPSMRSAPSKWYAKRTRTPKPAHCEKMRPG